MGKQDRILEIIKRIIEDHAKQNYIEKMCVLRDYPIECQRKGITGGAFEDLIITKLIESTENHFYNSLEESISTIENMNIKITKKLVNNIISLFDKMDADYVCGLKINVRDYLPSISLSETSKLKIQIMGENFNIKARDRFDFFFAKSKAKKNDKPTQWQIIGVIVAIATLIISIIIAFLP